MYWCLVCIALCRSALICVVLQGSFGKWMTFQENGHWWTYSLHESAQLSVKRDGFFLYVTSISSDFGHVPKDICSSVLFTHYCTDLQSVIIMAIPSKKAL
ncbi:unnamed protein product [Chrysodeixis includens]|uniref:Secreted protein n=1 Tax=Chrysodeixis includens TaxID=689277 RepID=A0A9N8Q2G6_CHRIL|nr:unnamed protein product [Chrysodeixis includens]